MPVELKAVLDIHPTTHDFSPEWAIPEMVTKLDKFRGEGRNQDLAVLGTSLKGKVFISIEVKADEPFGSSITASLAPTSSKSTLKRLVCEVSDL